MAEIKIEKKQPIWPWIIGILIVLAIIYFVWANNDDDYEADDALVNNDTISQIDESAVYNDNDVDTTSMYNGTYGTDVKEPAVADYFTYIDNGKMGIDHEYTNGALTHLISATEAEANKLNVDISANLDKARENASFIEKDPQSLKHADKIKNASMEISIALKTIQEQKFPNLSSEADAVKSAANDINPGTPTLEQKEDAKDFFDKAGRLLQKMNETERNQ